MVKDALRIAELEKTVAERTAELIQRGEELSVINSVQEALAQEMDLQGIYDLVGDRVQKLFDSQAVIIATFDIPNKIEHFNYTFENGEKFKLESKPYNKLREILIENKHTVYIKTEQQAKEEFGITAIGNTQMPKTLLFVPLLSGPTIQGYVSLQNIDKENAFSDSEIRLLETLANSMSAALQNARLLKETEQRTAELAVINSVQEGLAKELDIQAIYDLVGNRVRELFDAQVVGIGTFDHETGTETLHYLIEKGERYYPTPKPINSLRRHIIQSKEKLLINQSFSTVADTFGIKPVPGTQQPKSAVYVPLVIGDKVPGYVSLQNLDKENAFTESDVRLLETLANTMGVSLENARLFDETNRLLKETEQQKAELGVINSVQEGLAKELNMQAIYDLVGDRIRDLFNAQAVIIATFDHETATEHFKYIIEDGQRFYMASRPYDKLRQHLILQKQKIVINEKYEEAYIKFGLKILPGTNMTKSGVFVPLVIGDKVNSYISLQNNETEHAFSDSDIRLLETLANSMSVALENARLFDETTRLLKETEQRTAELAVINSVQEGLAKELDMNAIYDLIGNKIRDIFNAQSVIIATFDHDAGMERFDYLFENGERFNAPARRYDKLRYQMITTKQKIWINNNAEEAFREFGLKVISDSALPKSLLYVPLVVGNKVTSYVSLQHTEKENAFTESDVRLLETLANSMSVALENARLFDETTRLLKETEQRTAELGIINSVQEGLASKLDIQAIYDLVGDKIKDVFDAQGIGIAHYDSHSHLIKLPYYVFRGKRTAFEPFKLGKGLASTVINTGHVLLINENAVVRQKELGAVFAENETEENTCKSWLGVPLISGGIVNGIIKIENYEKEHAYTESDISLLQTLANSISVALENAKLFDETNRLLKETEQRNAELAVINSVQESLVAQLDMDSIYELVGEKIRNIFQAQVIDIVTYDKQQELISGRYSYEKGDRTTLGPRKPTGFRKHVIETGQLLLHNDNVEQAMKDFGNEILIGDCPKSQVYIPMIAGGEVKGIISLQNLDHEHAFSDSDVSLITTLANSMSVALESARLFDETNRLLKETEQRTAELAVINSVQEGLSRELDIHGIYKLVGNRLCNLFPDTQTLVIRTFDHISSQEYFEYFIEKGEELKVEPRPFMWANKQLIQSKHSLLINTDYVETAKKYGGTGVTKGQPPKSAVFVPMLVGDVVKGSISLQNVDRENAFTDSDLRLLTTITNSMSVALENARLFDETSRLLKETEQRTAELAVINSVQDGLAKELDMNGIYHLVGDRVQKLFNAQSVLIATFDHENKTEHFNYNFEKGELFFPKPRPLNKLRQQLIKEKHTIYIETEEKAVKEFGITPIEGTEMTKSLLFVPLLTGTDIRGYVSIQNVDNEHAFSESDIRLLETLANSMSVALENARLFDETNRLLKETEQRTAELAVINSVQDGLAKELDIQAIYDLIGDRIIKVFNAPNLVIRTFDHETDQENWRYAIEKGERQYIEPKPFVWHSKLLIQTQKPIQINENYLETSKKFGGAGVFVGQPTKSGIFVPMIVGGIVKGSVSLQHVDKENAYTEADLRLLTTITNSMSVALENARLFDETNRLLKETEQRTAELAIINSVQEGLASKLDNQSIYDLVGDKIRDVFDTQGIAISYYDRAANRIEHHYNMFRGRRLANYGFDFGEGLTSNVIKSGQPLLINKFTPEIDKALGTKMVPGETDENTSKSWLGVPLLSGGVVNGSIKIENYDRQDAYTESDVSLLQTLANSISVALENARLFDETNRLLKETEQRTAELAVINSVQEGLAKELDMNGIYKMVGDRLCDLFPDTQTLVIRTFDHDKGLESFQYAIEKGVHLEVGPRGFMWANKTMIQTKKPIDIRENYVETAKKHGGTGVTTGKPPKSAVFVPMLVGDTVKGSISLQNVDQEHAFNDSDLRLLTTITNSMSVALENARLFDETNRLLKETEQRTGELAVINSVQDGLVREMDIQAIYDLVGNRICRLFDTQTVVIRTFDLENGKEQWRFVMEKGERMYSEPRPLIWANKRLIETKQPLLIKENYLETARKYGGQGVSKGQPPKSAMFVPMMVGDLVRGSVSLQNIDRENAFTDSDLRLLTTLTNSMSVALENARLFDETTVLLAQSKQRAAELSTVNSISKALASQLDPDDLIKMVGDQLKELFNANIIYLALLDKKTNIINFPYQNGDTMDPLKLGEGMTSKVILSGEPMLVNKDLQEWREQQGIESIGVPAASGLWVPIPIGDENLGVLSVQSTEMENRFNENDLRLLTTIASSVGVALRNATLFEDVKLAKMEAEAATKQAEKANEAKSAFLSTVSHELRTPLTSVLGFTKIIRKRLDEKIFPIVSKADLKTEKIIQQVSANLNVVISEGERLTHLINDVLDLAKIEAGKMEWNQENVSMAEIAERAIAATSSLFDQKPLKLVKDIDLAIPEIKGDKDKLIQVIINLISNAVKFTEQGSITVKVKGGKDELIVSINDTGIGISEEDYAAVFEQFKQVGGDTLTDKPKGTGLGLPICKQIVEHHGGKIWLESKKGKGTTFHFSLPISVDQPKPRSIQLEQLVIQLKEQVSSSPLNLDGQGPNILIVDDDDSIRSLLNQELADAGYRIEEASNGKMALEKVRANRPDLILLDIMMPEMNGFDVAAVLKNDPETMDIPIIVLSVVKDKARGFRIGVDRYLTKPIDTGLLFNEIGSLLEQGKSKKKVMIVDEDAGTVSTLSEVLGAKGYHVMESDGKELVKKAMAGLPDIIIINSLLSEKQDFVESLRFEKGLENVLFLVYQ